MRNQIIIFIGLMGMLIAVAAPQIKPVKICTSCQMPLSLCQYKGHHPTCKTCGEIIDKCAYKGKHPKKDKPKTHEPSAYDVSFSCNVSTATMYIDGERYGTPNGIKNLKKGNHTVRLIADGYEEYSSSINVAKGNTSFHFDMDQTLYDITINTNVDDVTIRVDGNVQNNQSLRLPQGEYSLTLTAEGYEKYSTEISINKDQTSFNFNLIRSVLTFNIDGVVFTMIYVEGGTFMMGATSEQENDAYENEKPIHRVELSSFYIGETEVTEEMYYALKGLSYYSNGSKEPLEEDFKRWEEFIKEINDISGLKFRMPTEAEWEYAARGGSLSKGFKYSGSDYLNDVAWYEDNSNEAHCCPVARKKPNELGLYDMSGNVAEWCIDCYLEYSNESQINPLITSLDAVHKKGLQGAVTHVVRGGSTISSMNSCRVSARSHDVESYFFETPINFKPRHGLRLVLSASEFQD